MQQLLIVTFVAITFSTPLRLNQGKNASFEEALLRPSPVLIEVAEKDLCEEIAAHCLSNPNTAECKENVVDELGDAAHWNAVQYEKMFKALDADCEAEWKTFEANSETYNSNTATGKKCLADAVKWYGGACGKKSLVEKAQAGESIIVTTNQGRFGPAGGSAFLQSSITPDAMLQKTGGRDPSATLEKAWAKGDPPHITLLMQFSDGNCEQMEWYPHDGATATLGEHSAGEARLHPNPTLFGDGSQCSDAASFLDMTDETAKVPFDALVALHANKQKVDVDVARWSAAQQKSGEDAAKTKTNINRRGIYSAFLEETRRYKDEEKYGCPSFVNNVFGLVTGQPPVQSSKMVSLLKMASKLGEEPSISTDECCRICQNKTYAGNLTAQDQCNVDYCQGECDLTVCVRPDSGCTKAGDVYVIKDCDLDGVDDLICTATIDNKPRRWVVYSEDGCGDWVDYSGALCYGECADDDEACWVMKAIHGG